MKIGNNTFAVLVQDISGNDITGLLSSDFTLGGVIGGVSYNSITMTETAVSGVYSGDVNITTSGTGFLKIDTTTASHQINPPIFNVDVTQHSNDDVYNRLANNFLDVSPVNNSSLVTASRTTVEGDDEIFIVATGEDLTGFTDLKSTMIYSNTADASGSNVVGDLTVTTFDLSGNVTISIPRTITEGIVPNGKNTIRTYSDLQARDSGGNRKTLATITHTIRRQYTIN